MLNWNHSACSFFYLTFISIINFIFFAWTQQHVRNHPGFHGKYSLKVKNLHWLTALNYHNLKSWINLNLVLAKYPLIQRWIIRTGQCLAWIPFTSAISLLTSLMASSYVFS